MIVRNEAKVIARCLESVKRLIAFWIICDTGSSDETEQVIRQSLVDIPGEFHHDVWRDFGHNRSLSLSRARGKADYYLLLDADMVLNGTAELPDLVADQYLIRFDGPWDYSVPRLLSDRHVWTYHGVTHEYVDSPTAAPATMLGPLSITHHEDGGGRSQRYQRDTALLEEGLKSDPTNSRYHYYLAQCYRDSGRHAAALVWYEKRVPLGGWNQEVWSALYQMGRMQEALNHDWRAILHTYLQAYNFRPTRLEPIYRIVRFYRGYQQYSLGLLLSRLVTEVDYPSDILFVEKDVYDYLLPLEHAACCIGAGRVEEGRSVCRSLLESGRLPLDQVLEVETLMELEGRMLPVGFAQAWREATHPAGSGRSAEPRIGREHPDTGCGNSSNPLEPDGTVNKGALSFVAPGWWER